MYATRDGITGDVVLSDRPGASHRLHIGVRQFREIVHVLSWNAEAADFYAEIRTR